MKTNSLLIPGLAALSLAAVISTSAQTPEADLVIPKGDANRGENVFTEELCFRCHTVEKTELPDFDLPAKLKLHLGGGDYRLWTRDTYAKAIMNPEHWIAPQYQAVMKQMGDPVGAKDTPMPNMNATLTVADLIDLASFLASKSR